MLGILYAQEGNIAGAHQNFMTAIEKDPKNVEAYFNLGNLALQEQQVQTAIQFYRQVLALEPEHQGALERLAQISKAMEQIRQSQT
jgi:tetratricopeptide (TPR) repeat protein